MSIRSKIELRSFVVGLAVIALLSFVPEAANATHNGLHPVPCDAPGTVGGGALGLSPGPVGPPSSLGWDVGSGQCNGSFTSTSDPGYPGGTLELGLRAEQRRIGQVARVAPNDYTVMTGADIGPPAAINRAWWNFQASIAYGGSIAGLDALTLGITTHVGPNLPAAPVVDLLAVRGFIDDRNNQPNATVGFADLYQISQNPEFGWFSPTSDTDANPTGAFDYDAPGAWTFTLTAVEGTSTAQTSICIHTPGETCPDTVGVVNVLQDCWTTDTDVDSDIEKEDYQFDGSLPDTISFIWKHKILETCSAYETWISVYDCIDYTPNLLNVNRKKIIRTSFGLVAPDPLFPEQLFRVDLPASQLPPGRYDWFVIVECDDTDGKVRAKDGDVDDLCGVRMDKFSDVERPFMLGPAPLNKFDADPGGSPLGRGPGESGTSRAWCFDVTAPD